MIIHWLTSLISLLFVIINAHVNLAGNIGFIEHKPSDIIDNNSTGQSWKTTTEKILIRVPRLNDYGKSISDRQYPQMVDGINIDTEEIWGMAKKVAITVFVLVALCIVCCITTTIYICAKCCCGGNNRKRNQGFTTVPQPVVIHTGPPNYHPQFYQQQAPPTQTWNLENHPMLPQPSAPPQPNDDFHMERPPPYEKICTSR